MKRNTESVWSAVQLQAWCVGSQDTHDTWDVLFGNTEHARESPEPDQMHSAHLLHSGKFR